MTTCKSFFHRDLARRHMLKGIMPFTTVSLLYFRCFLFSLNIMEIIHLDKDLKVKVKCMKSRTSVVWTRTTKIIFCCLFNKTICLQEHTLYSTFKQLSYSLQNMWREIINHNGALNYDSGQRQSCDLVAWRFFGFSPPQCAWSLLYNPKLDVPKKLWLAFESHPAIYKGSLDSWLVVLH